ncbi:MAG TPA: glycogen synthase GlgA [Opitutaceae bacterium]|nr:glycogen synthase GlgA [Opitutaceae bacterium]
MKIVHAASELFPYIKTGGLADAAGALTGALADRGHEVAVFLPGYRTVREHPDAAKAERRLQLRIEMGDQTMAGEVRVFSPRPNLTVHLICRDEFFDRGRPYGNGERDYEDNADRFLFFCKGVVETLRQGETTYDIAHGHDWQAAMLPLLLREAERRHGRSLADKTVFTVHNIAYQGVFPAAAFARANLPEEFFAIDGLEFYGQVNFLKGGLLFADRLTTVSPRYAQEIQTAEFGCGLEGVIQSRGGDLTGLLNGIDPAVWNPAVDPLLPERYSAGNLAGKAACRAQLLDRCGFDPKSPAPVFGMVCRLVEQKGLDLLLANKEFFLKQDCRLVILGAGDRKFEEALRALAAQAPRKIFLSARLDEAMSHLIEAGSDFFVMPSLFEPCGLNQMYSQAYGTVPVVSRVGGLMDTVVDADDQPASGTGLMAAPTAAGLRGALARALKLFQDPARLAAVQRRGMGRDFSWRAASAAYESLYQDTV